MDSIAESLKSLAGSITSGLGDRISNILGDSVTNIINGIADISDWKTLLTFPVTIITGLGDRINEIATAGHEFLINKITDLWDNFTENLETIIDNGNEVLMSGIKKILQELFVPEEDYISEKVAAIRERFAFADSVMSTAESIKEAVYGAGNDGAPRITINLNAAESKYNYGGSALALDMSWYSRYKPTVDTVLSAIIWVAFVWRVFVHLPNIISGIGGSVETIDGFEKAMIKRSKEK